MNWAIRGLEIITIMLALSLFNGLIQKEQAEGGKQGSVRLPMALHIVGLLGGGFFGVLTVLAAKEGSVGAAAAFGGFALLSLSLVIARLNIRVTYDTQGFTVQNFFGFARRYLYTDITGMRGGRRDVRLYMGERSVLLDGSSVGLSDFLRVAERYARKPNGKRGIQSLPGKQRRRDLFLGHVENPEEFIAVFVLLGVGMLAFLIFIGVHTPRSEEQLAQTELSFVRSSQEEGDLYLFTEDGVSCRVLDWRESVFEPEIFLSRCVSGERFAVSYDTYGEKKEKYSLRSITDEKGRVLLSPEITQRQVWQVYWANVSVSVGLCLILVAFFAATVYVGRHPEKFSDRVLHFFFKPGYIRR